MVTPCEHVLGNNKNSSCQVANTRHPSTPPEDLAGLEKTPPLLTNTIATISPRSLAPAMQKHLSAVSQMVAKIVATRADYEVTRQVINRKNPAEDSDWDRKVEALRYKIELAVAAAVRMRFSHDNLKCPTSALPGAVEITQSTLGCNPTSIGLKPQKALFDAIQLHQSKT